MLSVGAVMVASLRRVTAPADAPAQTRTNATVNTVDASPVQQTPVEPPASDTTIYPVTYSDQAAASITVVVKKKHRLPSTYAPALVSIQGGSLRPEAAEAFNALISEAANDGHALKNISAYRSYQTQVSVYNGWVAQYGQAEADTFSARPGHSEHQTGLAVDIAYADGSYALEQSFGDTPAGQWIAANAPRFGFIIRYQKGRDAETGYSYEPWHLRYVGAAAQAITASGQTMDQYYGVAAGGY